MSYGHGNDHGSGYNNGSGFNNRRYFNNNRLTSGTTRENGSVGCGGSSEEVSDALSEANNGSKERERETSFESESCMSTITDENHVTCHRGDVLLLSSPVVLCMTNFIWQVELSSVNDTY